MYATIFNASVSPLYFNYYTADRLEVFLYSRDGRQSFLDTKQNGKDNRLAFQIPANRGRLWSGASA